VRWHPAIDEVPASGWPRLGSDFATQLWTRLTKAADPMSARVGGKSLLFSKKTALYWLPVSPWHTRTIGALGGEVGTNEESVSLPDEETVHTAYALLAGKMGLVLWQSISDDFNVTRRHLLMLPVVVRDKKTRAEIAEIGAAAAAYIQDEPGAHLWTPYGGYWIESIDNRLASPTFDIACGMLLETLGMADRWDELQAWYWRTMKTTGERNGTERGLTPPTRTIKGGNRRHRRVARLG